jgi:hypothetical protein
MKPIDIPVSTPPGWVSEILTNPWRASRRIAWARFSIAYVDAEITHRWHCDFVCQRTDQDPPAFRFAEVRQSRLIDRRAPCYVDLVDFPQNADRRTFQWTDRTEAETISGANQRRIEGCQRLLHLGKTALDGREIR